MNAPTLDPGRAARAAAALSDGAKVEAAGDGTYRVPSFSGNGVYRVSLEDRTCDCADHRFGGNVCKHQIAAQLWRLT